MRRGGRGGYALIAVSSLPDAYRGKLKTLYPDPSMEVLLAWLEANYETDQAAVAYFNDWRTQCGHDHATDEHVREYVTNASVLNACIKLYNNAKAIQRTMGQKYDWSMMSQAVEGYRMKTGHTLPSSMLRFRKKVAEYQRDGYACLISGKFGNQASRKVDYRTERLILSIAALPNKPFNTNVWEMYNSFVCGELDVYDPETGELFDPSEWTDKNGDPKSLSESTITNYLNKPKNRLFIEHSQDTYTTFMHEQMPHVHRHAPEFSFSKISFDDRDLPRKLKDTKARPKAYYAYDVASQCVVGYAYNRSKNVDLVADCFRSMFRLIESKGWGCPAQVEVENHLMSQWKPIVNGVEYRAEPQITLHIVTDWAGAASEGSPFREEALAVFDLPDKIHRRLANLEGETFGEFDLAQSITNHNHEDIVETMEVYQYVAIKRL